MTIEQVTEIVELVDKVNEISNFTMRFCIYKLNFFDLYIYRTVSGNEIKRIYNSEDGEVDACFTF